MTGVSRETSDDFAQYANLVRKWSPTINLVARSQLADLEERHIADSQQLIPLVPAQAISLTDIGSGGGFPGLVLAIAAKQSSPGRTFTLIESDQRKATFLRTVVRDLSLNATVLAKRIEAVSIPPSDVVTARALAPLAELLAHAAHLLKPDGTAIFPKGETWEEELNSARQRWSFSCQAIPSGTRTNARILVIKDLSRAPDR